MSSKLKFLNMKNLNLTPFLFVLSILSGCASPSTKLKHSDGRTVTCSASGFGLGAAIAYGHLAECVKKHKALGFEEV